VVVVVVVVSEEGGKQQVKLNQQMLSKIEVLIKTNRTFAEQTRCCDH